MNIVVTLLSGEEVSLSISFNRGKVFDVKKAIEKLKGRSLQNQKMRFNNSILNDDDNLLTSGVTNGSKLRMIEELSKTKDSK